jgi:hypothetical protein
VFDLYDLLLKQCYDVMLGCNSYFGDGLKTGIFDGYLYVMTFFIYFGTCCVDVKFTTLFPREGSSPFPLGLL